MSGSDSPTFFHGQPWSNWIEKIGRDKPLSDEEPDTEPTSCVTRLSADDIDLYGFCPERDTFYGVVCEICNAIVKPQALIQHMESRHASGTVNLPPPSTTPTSKAPVKTPYCKVSKLTKKLQGSANNNGGTSMGGTSGGNANTSKVNHTSNKRNADLISNPSPRSPPESSFSSTPVSATSITTCSDTLTSDAHTLIPTTTATAITKTITSIGTASATATATAAQAPSPPPPPPPPPPSSSASSSTSTTAIVSSSNLIASSPVKSPANNSNTSINNNNNNNATVSNSGVRRKRLKTERGLLKDREYDPDRHCGVWNEETQKPCTRSLTCKAHTVSLRRTVAGRSKSFDKLLAEHRASKDLPNRTSKITVTGTVTVSNNTTVPPNSNIPLTNDNGTAPGSPPVLSLPDTYPLPKAVDLLYRCLAPHGSTKPTKLEEDFVKEEMRLESSLSSCAAETGSMGPISVVLPSLSPIAVSSEATTTAGATLIPASAVPPPSLSVVSTTPLPAPNAQLPNTVLEGETLSDVNPDSMTLYSPMSIFKDTKPQVVMQLSRSNNLIQSPISRNYQDQTSMPSLVFEDQMDNPKQQLANGKRLNNHMVIASTSIGRPSKKAKHEFESDSYSTTALEVESTTSPSYSHFSDLAWSNCHPEPLAVTRWLRITSTRKQYNFNIH